MPVIAGRKSKLESFAGANVTYTIEAMMGDKKALQVRHKAATYGNNLFNRMVSTTYAVFSPPMYWQAFSQLGWKVR